MLNRNWILAHFNFLPQININLFTQKAHTVSLKDYTIPETDLKLLSAARKTSQDARLFSSTGTDADQHCVHNFLLA